VRFIWLGGGGGGGGEGDSTKTCGMSFNNLITIAFHY